MSTPFTPSRAAGLARLQSFLPRAGRAYAAQRNFDRGPDDRTNVSGLSPYVRHRLVTEAEVVRAALGAHGLAAAEKFVQEQFWRTYWKGWLELRPRVWTDWLAGVEAAQRALEADPATADRHTVATAGRTGIDCFDAWVAELRDTGYLHNHARMWFASIWIFTLRLPWELGAALFMRHLLDGDPASNTLSWRWVGGLQTVGKTYLARRSNIREYTDGRFDPPNLAHDAPPLTGPQAPPAGRLPDLATPDPDASTGLLLHEEDLAPDSLDIATRVAGVAGLRASPAHSPTGVAPGVAAWVADALDEACGRAGDMFGVEPMRPAGPDPLAAVVDWARTAGFRQIVTPYAPVGPVADRLAAIETALAPHGVRLVRLLRPYDRACWPHATRGFFTFKEKIPVLIRELGLD